MCHSILWSEYLVYNSQLLTLFIFPFFMLLACSLRFLSSLSSDSVTKMITKKYVYNLKRKTAEKLYFVRWSWCWLKWNLFQSWLSFPFVFSSYRFFFVFSIYRYIYRYSLNLLFFIYFNIGTHQDIYFALLQRVITIYIYRSYKTI